MSHEVEHMFYCGEVPWHGLGVKLDSPPTVREAIIAAGLDWRVDRKVLVMQDNPDTVVPAFATVRDYDASILGVVGPNYHVLQNEDAFNWFQPYLDSGEVELHTAGSLRKGRHVWILAKIKADPIEIVPGDEVLQFVLLSNAHDSSSSIRAGLTAIRTVCANTLAAAHNSASSKLIRVRHTSNAPIALEKVRETLDLARREFRATADGMAFMASKGCNLDDLKRYVREVFEVPPAESTDRLMGKIIPLFDAGRGADLSRGTMWGAYNSVTELLNWERGRSADVRLENLWFGQAAKLGQRAYDVAVEFAAAA